MVNEAGRSCLLGLSIVVSVMISLVSGCILVACALVWPLAASWVRSLRPSAQAIWALVALDGFLVLCVSVRSAFLASSLKTKGAHTRIRILSPISTHVSCFVLPAVVLNLALLVWCLVGAALSTRLSRSKIMWSALSYSREVEAREDMDSLQRTLQCCGMNRSADWQAWANDPIGNLKYSERHRADAQEARSSASVIPDSCCSEIDSSSKSLTPSGCRPWEIGCFQPLSNALTVMHLSTALFAFILALLLVSYHRNGPFMIRVIMLTTLVALCLRIARNSAKSALESGDPSAPGSAYRLRAPRGNRSNLRRSPRLLDDQDDDDDESEVEAMRPSRRPGSLALHRGAIAQHFSTSPTTSSVGSSFLMGETDTPIPTSEERFMLEAYAYSNSICSESSRHSRADICSEESSYEGKDRKTGSNMKQADTRENSSSERSCRSQTERSETDSFCSGEDLSLARYSPKLKEKNSSPWPSTMVKFESELSKPDEDFTKNASVFTTDKSREEGFINQYEFLPGDWLINFTSEVPLLKDSPANSEAFLSNSDFDQDEFALTPLPPLPTSTVALKWAVTDSYTQTLPEGKTMPTLNELYRTHGLASIPNRNDSEPRNSTIDAEEFDPPLPPLPSKSPVQSPPTLVNKNASERKRSSRQCQRKISESSKKKSVMSEVNIDSEELFGPRRSIHTTVTEWLQNSLHWFSSEDIQASVEPHQIKSSISRREELNKSIKTTVSSTSNSYQSTRSDFIIVNEKTKIENEGNSNNSSENCTRFIQKNLYEEIKTPGTKSLLKYEAGDSVNECKFLITVNKDEEFVILKRSQESVLPIYRLSTKNLLAPNISSAENAWFPKPSLNVGTFKNRNVLRNLLLERFSSGVENNNKAIVSTASINQDEIRKSPTIQLTLTVSKYFDIDLKSVVCAYRSQNMQQLQNNLYLICKRTEVATLTSLPKRDCFSPDTREIYRTMMNRRIRCIMVQISFQLVRPKKQNRIVKTRLQRKAMPRIHCNRIRSEQLMPAFRTEKLENRGEGIVENIRHASEPFRTFWSSTGQVLDRRKNDDDYLSEYVRHISLSDMPKSSGHSASATSHDTPCNKIPHGTSTTLRLRKRAARHRASSILRKRSTSSSASQSSFQCPHCDCWKNNGIQSLGFGGEENSSEPETSETSDLCPFCDCWSDLEVTTSNSKRLLGRSNSQPKMPYSSFGRQLMPLTSSMSAESFFYTGQIHMKYRTKRHQDDLQKHSTKALFQAEKRFQTMV